MLSDATYDEALRLIVELTDALGDLDPSIEGYITLLEYAKEEIGTSLAAAKCDLGEELEDL